MYPEYTDTYTGEWEYEYFLYREDAELRLRNRVTAWAKDIAESKAMKSDEVQVTEKIDGETIRITVMERYVSRFGDSMVLDVSELQLGNRQKIINDFLLWGLP